MLKAGRFIIWVILFILVFGIGIALTHFYYQSQKEEETRSRSTVLLEKVEQVMKLVTVEGNFDELYDETNRRSMTLMLPFPSTWTFSKSAIIRVSGKVLVGYDMENIEIEADSLTRTIYLRNMPEPEILSIDHEVSYQNLEESYFNSFEPEDFTKLNQNAKKVLEEKAQESRLLDEAADQGNQVVEVIKFMAESAGWTVVVEQQELSLPEKN